MNLNKIILTIISIIISTAILEVGLRLYVKKDTGIYELEMMKYAKELKEIKTYKDQKYIKHKPNKNSVKIMNTVISTDKRGYRKSEINVSEELPKIILLGDSMTFGFGSRITFSDILQKKFKNKYEILNTAVGNTNTIMQITYFFSEMKNYSTKFIILNFYINDFENIDLNKKNFLNTNFYLYNFLSFRLSIISSEKKNYVKYYRDTFLNKDIEKKTFNKILELKKYSEKNDIIFLVNFIPDLRNIENYPFKNEENLLKRFLVKNNISFLEHFENFKGLKSKNLWVSDTDPHPNEFTHNILSINLGDYIDKKK